MRGGSISGFLESGKMWHFWLPNLAKLPNPDLATLGCTPPLLLQDRLKLYVTQVTLLVSWVRFFAKIPEIIFFCVKTED